MNSPKFLSKILTLHGSFIAEDFVTIDSGATINCINSAFIPNNFVNTNDTLVFQTADSNQVKTLGTVSLLLHPILRINSSIPHIRVKFSVVKNLPCPALLSMATLNSSILDFRKQQLLWRLDDPSKYIRIMLNRGYSCLYSDMELECKLVQTPEALKKLDSVCAKQPPQSGGDVVTDLDLVKLIPKHIPENLQSELKSHLLRNKKLFSHESEVTLSKMEITLLLNCPYQLLNILSLKLFSLMKSSNTS